MTTAMFRTINLNGTADPPPGVCPACLQQSMEHGASGLVAAFCSHNRIGGWKFPGMQWEMITDTDFNHFRGDLMIVLLETDYTLNGGEERADAGVH